MRELDQQPNFLAGNSTNVKYGDHESYYYYDDDEGDLSKSSRKRRFLATSALMNIPTFSFEYFWKTFVTRFFISQNMKNYDVTTWPGKFYRKGRYHFANERSMLQAMKKTFFLTPTKGEVDKNVFLATATQAAILEMSDRTADFLVDKYKKHTIDVELKEYIEPSARFVRKRQPNELKTFLEEMFLVDLDKKIIPRLRTGKQKEDFRNIVLENLEEENLLLLMHDLRLFEIEKGTRKGGKKRSTNKHDTNHSDNEDDDVWLEEWWEAKEGETTHLGAISRLFNDLEAEREEGEGIGHPTRLIVMDNGGQQFHMDEEYAAKYYLHGIRLIFKHIIQRANDQLENFRKSERQQHPPPVQSAKMEEIHEEEIEEVERPKIHNQQEQGREKEMEKSFILNELRQATCFIFVESADKINYHESEFSDLNDTFFPGKEAVDEKIVELEAQLENANREMEKLRTPYRGGGDSSPASGAMDASQPSSSRTQEKEKEEKAEKSGANTSKLNKAKNALISTKKNWLKKISIKAIFKGGKEGKEAEEEEERKRANKGKSVAVEDDGEDGQHWVEYQQRPITEEKEKQIAAIAEDLIEILVQLVDWCRYILIQPPEVLWTRQVEICDRLLCGSDSIAQVQLQSEHLEWRAAKLRHKIIEKMCVGLPQRIAQNRVAKKRTESARERVEKMARNAWHKTTSALFGQSHENQFEEFFKKKCAKMDKQIEREKGRLKAGHLGGMRVLGESREERSARMGAMIKRECLFEMHTLRRILKRFFRLETEGILTIQYEGENDDDDDEHIAMLEQGGTRNRRIRRSAFGAEFFLVFALAEPIIETTILQQIFRQWNFYKWFQNCVRRSFRYKELRCKEPVVNAEKKQFTGVLTTTVFEELTKQGAENVCHVYKHFVDNNLMPLKETVIKYPSVVLRELGIKLSNITKDWMDTAWRQINSLKCLREKRLDELKELWTKLARMAKEQKDLDDAWAHLAEFLTLSSRGQQQWIVGRVLCPTTAKMGQMGISQVECLRKKLKEIASGADTQRELKVRVKGTFKSKSPNMEIAHLFELIMMRREDFFAKFLGKMLSSRDDRISTEFLLLSMFAAGDWKFIRDFLTIYAERKNQKNGWHSFVSKQFAAAVTSEKNPTDKFVLKLLKERFERIMANNPPPNRGEEEQKTLVALYEKCGDYARISGNEHSGGGGGDEEIQPQHAAGTPSKTEEIGEKMRHEILDAFKEVVIAFDAGTIGAVKDGIRVHCGTFLHLSQLEKEEKGGKLKEMGAAKMGSKKSEGFGGIVKMLSIKRKSSKNATKGNQVEVEGSGGINLEEQRTKMEFDAVQKILIVSGLLGENVRYKFVARKFREATLEARFEDVRFIIGRHLGINFSKILNHYEGGIEQANRESGIWRHRGDKENDALKKNFGKIYATIMKQFSTNEECIKEVEEQGNEQRENYLSLRSAMGDDVHATTERIRTLINALRGEHQVMDSFKRKEKDCHPEPTIQWIEMKFNELLGADAERTAEELLDYQPKSCLGMVAQGLDKILKEIVGANEVVVMPPTKTKRGGGDFPEPSGTADGGGGGRGDWHKNAAPTGGHGFGGHDESSESDSTNE